MVIAREESFVISESRNIEATLLSGVFGVGLIKSVDIKDKAYSAVDDRLDSVLTIEVVDHHGKKVAFYHFITITPGSMRPTNFTAFSLTSTSLQSHSNPTPTVLPYSYVDGRPFVGG